MNVEVEKLLQIIGALTVENALLREQMDVEAPAEPEVESRERRPLSEIEVERMKQVAHEG